MAWGLYTPGCPVELSRGDLSLYATRNLLRGARGHIVRETERVDNERQYLVDFGGGSPVQIPRRMLQMAYTEYEVTRKVRWFGTPEDVASTVQTRLADDFADEDKPLHVTVVELGEPADDE